MVIDVNKSIVWLIENQSLSLPYGFLPGMNHGGQNLIDTQAKWNAYTWNPPQYLSSFNTADPNASAKPTWAELVSAHNAANLSDTRRQLVELANAEVTNRIAKNYHPQAHLDRNKEWETRLSGDDMTAKDAERTRLIAVCHTLEASINAATTVTALEAIDVTSDSVWAAPEEND